MTRGELLISFSSLKLPKSQAVNRPVQSLRREEMISSLGILRTVRTYRLAALAMATVAGLLLGASGTQAGGCADPLNMHNKPAAVFPNHQEISEWAGPHTIVGLWHVTYTATYDDNFPPGGPYPPTPFPFLESFKTWHGDGTEFENAFLPPAGGNVCFGVWKDLGDQRVKLHHIGLMFNPDGSLSSIFTVDEKDTVSSDGKTYEGVFDFKLWPPSYDAVGKGTPIAEVKGTTAATRITVD
jgi:hypothetical protein